MQKGVSMYNTSQGKANYDRKRIDQIIKEGRDQGLKNRDIANTLRTEGLTTTTGFDIHDSQISKWAFEVGLPRRTKEYTKPSAGPKNFYGNGKGNGTGQVVRRNDAQAFSQSQVVLEVVNSNLSEGAKMLVLKALVK